MSASGRQGCCESCRREIEFNSATFTGFCSGHDGSLFKPIDTEPLVPTAEQEALLGYRTHCRELGRIVMERAPQAMKHWDYGLDPVEQFDSK